MQFAREQPRDQGIEGYVSEEEKRESVKRALDLHMIENREVHLRPAQQTLFSFTQGDPNAVIGSGHSIQQKSEEKQEKKLTIEEQRTQQQNDFSSSLSSQSQPMQVRSCPCCISFLQHKFGMSEGEAKKFAMGSDSAGVGYAASSGADYASGGSSGNYSGGDGGSGGGYSGSSGGGGGGNYGGSGGGGYNK
ncbi:hypothetical protein HYU06_04630 [Candidatus Woesearchaeota archaeon]|nr:hypothetical protein [Candidatus Woesearchaeota archaeon]